MQTGTVADQEQGSSCPRIHSAQSMSAASWRILKNFWAWSTEGSMVVLGVCYTDKGKVLRGTEAITSGHYFKPVLPRTGVNLRLDQEVTSWRFQSRGKGRKCFELNTDPGNKLGPYGSWPRPFLVDIDHYCKGKNEVVPKTEIRESLER